MDPIYIEALKFLGPLAIVLWIVLHTYTRLIPELMAGFRGELKAFRRELAAERESRERMLGEERAMREALTAEFTALRLALIGHEQA